MKHLEYLAFQGRVHRAEATMDVSSQVPHSVGGQSQFEVGMQMLQE